MVAVGDILKYIPTSTVGKVTDISERNGKIWVKLDYTNLYYDIEYLETADASEYKAVRYKEREKTSVDSRVDAVKALENAKKAEEEVDIREFTPSGGG